MREIARDVFITSLVLLVLGLPAQVLLGVTLRRASTRLPLAVAGAVAIVLVAALATDIIFYRYDGSVAHTLALFVTLTIFSVSAHALFFLGAFRFKRPLPRFATFAAGTLLILIGVLAFFFRTLAYGLQHSLGGWP